MHQLTKMFRQALLFIILSANILQAQAEDPYLFNLDIFNPINSVGRGKYIPHTSEHFSIFSAYSSRSGEFRGFTEPAKTHNAVLGFKGFKVIDEAQSFSGEFKVFKNIREQWNWVFVRDNMGFSPVLLGDSTTGSARFNGIQMQGEYNYQFNTTDNIHASLAYLVDEGLKQLTPRPVSEHRDVRFDLSGSYGFFGWLKVRGGILIGDLNETISYREDEGGLTQETVLLKFSGFDLPSVIRSKTETRFQYINIYGASAGMDLSLSESVKIGVGYKGQITKRIQKDDALDPRLAGYIRGVSDDVSLNSRILVGESGAMNLVFGYSNELGWSRAAERNVMYSRADNERYYSRISYEYRLSGAIKIYPLISLDKINFSFTDHFSDISFGHNFYRLGAELGTYCRISDIIEFGGSVYYIQDLSAEDRMTIGTVSGDYLAFRMSEIKKLITDISIIGIRFESKIKAGRHDYIIPEIGYTGIIPDRTYFSGGNSNFYFNLSYSLGI
ncbi:MAG: hypothetical protein HUU54_01195 [Ignavibacteriaceae bacterium]|nr:hypothetical protein [Ignavibacteriaceae bacterium]